MSQKRLSKKKAFKKRRLGIPPKRKFGPLYRVPFRRRREQKTDYQQRKRLLKSGLIRATIRPSNKSILVQFIRSKIGGDQTIIEARSVELKEFGWDIATSNLPSAYLTGYLAGKKALKSNLEDAILDIGTFEALPGTRMFAALKGIADAGIEIPFNDKMVPDETRIKGDHIASYGKILAEDDKEKYKRFFAKYLVVKKKPEDTPKYFASAKDKIDAKLK